MGFDFESFAEDYLSDLRRTLSEVSKPQIEALWDELTAVAERGGSIHMIGNGGSAADAQHISAELSGKFYLDRPPLFAEALLPTVQS